VLAIISQGLAIANTATTDSLTGKALALGYIANISVLIVALVALAGRRIRGPLLPYVLGSGFLALPDTLYQVLVIPGSNIFASYQTMHAQVSWLLASLSDVADIVAVIILLIVVRRMAGRGRWASPRIIPALLLVGVVLAWLAWTGVWTRKVYLAEELRYSDFTWGVGKFLSVDYPFAAFVASGLVAAVLAALCALRLQARWAGGVLLLGWTVSAFFLYAVEIISPGWRFSGWESTVNGIAVLLMLATTVLAIVYASRKGEA
jgi:hypothetical protein